MASSSAVGFTSGGIDVSSIVSGLMQVERLPVDRLINRQAEARAKSEAVGRLKSQLETLRTSSRDVVIKGVGKLTSSVSNSAAASVAVGTSATPGTTSFTVDRLATTNSVRSANPLVSTTAPLVSGSRFAFSSSVAKLGITKVTADSSASAGTYTIEVTQASSAAVKLGSAVSDPVVITDSNNSLDVTVNGVATSIELTSGSRTLASIAEELTVKLGAPVDVSVTAGGALRIATVQEGSTATLRVTGGSALTALGLTTDASAITGTDGALTVNGGAAITVTGTGAGTSVALGTGISGMDLGPLRVGSGTVTVVDVGDGSLQSVAAAVNAANAGVGAAAVKQSEGNWYLQLTSRTSGAAGEISVAPDDFVDLTAAQDAQLTVGSGAGALTVTSSSNVFTDVMPGTTITATAVSATPVTVSVSRDEGATADAVQALLNTANTLLNDIKNQTRFDPVSRSGGPLSGDGTVRALPGQIRAAVTETISGLTYSSVSAIGVTTQRDGTFALDREKFIDALRADPVAVERLFQRGGSSAGTNTAWAGADETTVAGTYSVAVTTAATRAATSTLTPSAGSTLGVRVGTTTASIAVTAGMAASTIVEQLNAAIAASGLGVSASVSGVGVVITANAYGSAGNFEVNTNVTGGGSWTSRTGVDVVGTIDGVTATGVGRRLTVPSDSTSTAKGLQVDVAPNTTGTLASVTYAPGAAARLTSLIAQLTGTSGSITTTTSSYDKRVSDYTSQISKYEEKLIAKEEQLRKQWAKVQTTLSGLENQQNWLTNQIKGLNRGD